MALYRNRTPFALSSPQTRKEVIFSRKGRWPTIIRCVLKDDVREILQKAICVGKGLGEPRYASNSKRGQFLSTAILKVLLEQRELLGYERILGVVDHDLYVPELNFVFGEASPRAAVISLTRLREAYYGRPQTHASFVREC